MELALEAMRRTVIRVPALFFAALLVTVERWEFTENRGSGGSGSSRSDAAPVGPYPDVLCGCTNLLENFA
jgi:hypothetical protein